MSCVRFRRGSWGVDFRDALGRRRFRRCRSQEEASRALAALDQEHKPVPAGEGLALTLDGYAELFFAEVRARSKPRTLARYRTAYRRHLAPELGSRALRSISRFELKRLLVKEHEAGVGLSMVVKVLSMLFAAAYEDGLVPQHPARRLKKIFRVDELPAEPKAFTAAELARFLEASRAEPRYDSLFRTMAFSGVRCGEARALQARDLDVEGLRLDVRRTFSEDKLSDSPKSGRARRVEIPAELAAELAELADVALGLDAWLFPRADGSFLRESSVRASFKRALSRAGLPSRFTAHSLRHTYASLLIQQGARAEYVQRQLGHRSIALTVDVYGRWLEISGYAELDRLVSRARVTKPAVTEDDDEGEKHPKLLRFRPLRQSLTRRLRRTSSSPQHLEPSADDEEPA